MIASLGERGLIKTVTSQNLEKRASETSLSLYCGVDPTASSLHVGNLLTLIPVLHFYIRGHNAFALVGGATGKVGDPAGKNAEREKLANETIAENVSSLTAQLSRFFQNGTDYAVSRGYQLGDLGKMKVVNNADWYANLNFMSFMNDVGRNVRLSSMLARDSVKNRLSGDGMSFGEFSYQLLQAYDFWQLHRHHKVNLQIGGSDQYGNITAGIDLIQRLQLQYASDGQKSDEVFGLTVPLLTTPSGEKFGKSAGNAVWLDPSLTSPFDLFQYFYRTPDTHLEPYLKLFTLLPLNEIKDIVARHEQEPSKRIANRILASDVVTLVHGSAALEKVQIALRLLFPADFSTTLPLTAEKIIHAFASDSQLVKLPRSEVVGNRVTTLLRLTGAVKSGKEAQQLIQGGGLHCADVKVTEIKSVVQDQWLLDGKVLVIRIGKNRFVMVQAI